ncbi:MAG: NUDIX domain-containing protein [Ginsengibacter sp.]
MSYITIYFEDKPVFLCDEITPEINEYRHLPDAVFIDELSTSSINSLLHEIKKPRFHAAIIYDKDFSKLKTVFFKHFELIKAGGGLVKNKRSEILMIFRRGKWDLPKGKLDEGESIVECAKREVEEETGLHHLKVISPLVLTYHTYNLFGKHILKETHWYLMEADENEKLIPQTEEEISEIVWVKKEDLKKYLSNTFPTITTVLKNA